MVSVPVGAVHDTLRRLWATEVRLVVVRLFSGSVEHVVLDRFPDEVGCTGGSVPGGCEPPLVSAGDVSEVNIGGTEVKGSKKGVLTG